MSPPRAAAVSEPPPAEDPGRSLSVRVSRAGAPVADAVIAAIRSTRLAEEFGLARKGDLVAEAVSDSSGTATIALPTGANHLLVRVTPQSLPAVSVPVPDPIPDHMDVSLPVGERITGRVEDPTGRGVAGVSVFATPVGFERTRLADSDFLAASSGHAVVQTARDGTFEIEGVPAGVLSLWASGDGWIGTEFPNSEVPTSLRIDEGKGPYHVRVPAWPVRAIALRLIDAASRTMINRAPEIVEVRRQAGVLESTSFRCEDARLFLNGRWRSFSTHATGGYLSAIVRVDQAVDIPARVEVRVETPGYGVVAVLTPLHFPSATPDAAHASVCVLSRLDEPAQGRLQIATARDYGRGVVPNPVRLWVFRNGKEPLALDASEVAGDRLVFAGVPAGEIEIFADDGIGALGPMTMTMPGSGTTAVEGTLEPVSGVALRVAPVEPGPISSPSVQVSATRVDPDPLVTYRSSTSLMGENQAFTQMRFIRPVGVPAVIPPDWQPEREFRRYYRLPPGKYKLEISASGFGSAETVVDVHSKTITHVDVQMSAIR